MLLYTLIVPFYCQGTFHYMNVLVFYSIGDGHLGGSQFGAIINKAAISTCTEVFEWIIEVFEGSFHLSKFPGMGFWVIW